MPVRLNETYYLDRSAIECISKRNIMRVDKIVVLPPETRVCNLGEHDNETAILLSESLVSFPWEIEHRFLSEPRTHFYLPDIFSQQLSYISSLLGAVVFPSCWRTCLS